MKPQDFDRLSAYLDHQLSPSEKAVLEQRLAREPELRAALTELRLTVKAVRSLPMVKPPRSFTLTAAQVGLPAGGRPQRRGSLFGTLRLAATMSAVAFALVVGGDFAASRGYFGPAAMPAEDVFFTTTENSATGASEQAEAQGATPEAELSVMSAEETSATLTPEEAPSGGSDGAPAPEGTPDMVAALVPESPTPTGSAQRSAEGTQVAEAAPDADQTATGDLFDTTEAEATASTKVVPPAAATPAADSALNTGESTQSTPQGLPPLRLLETALAMLTVLLGLGTWLARRNA